MHESMKRAMGIACANCESCMHIGSDGGDWEAGIPSFPTCEHRPGRDNLKSFPFKKEQPCWEPEFWHSIFAEMVKGDDASHDAACEAFHIAGMSVDPKWQRPSWMPSPSNTVLDGSGRGEQGSGGGIGDANETKRREGT